MKRWRRSTFAREANFGLMLLQSIMNYTNCFYNFLAFGRQWTDKSAVSGDACGMAKGMGKGHDTNNRHARAYGKVVYLASRFCGGKV